MALIAYKNDPVLKKKFVAEIIKHRKADQITQRTYGEENGKWKGCAVACSLRSLAILERERLVTTYDQHAEYETKLGIPEWLARLEDTIFEGLPVEDAKKWPEQFSEAIPVGANLEPVKWKFCAVILKENIDRVLTLKIADDLKKQVVDAIQDVLSLHENAVKIGKWDESAVRSAAESAAESAWSAAASAARSASESARSASESARSAAESAARSAWSAWSAARSAASAARSAESVARSSESAWSAAESASESAWSAARSAARSAAYQKYAKELLRLLKSAEINRLEK